MGPGANDNGVNVSRLNQFFPMLRDSRNPKLFRYFLCRLMAAITNPDNLNAGLSLEVWNMTATGVCARANNAYADSSGCGHDL